MPNLDTFKPLEKEKWAYGGKNIIEKYDATVTGELLDIEEEDIKKTPKSVPDFVQVFTKDLGYLKNVQPGDTKLLMGLFQFVDRNNEIVINSTRKKQISENIGISESSIGSSLTRLKKKQVLLSVGRGIYQLNPFIFGKGKWKQIHKLRMEFVYDFTQQVKYERFEQTYFNDEEQQQLLSKNAPVAIDVENLKEEQYQEPVSNIPHVNGMVNSDEIEHPNQSKINFEDIKTNEIKELEKIKLEILKEENEAKKLNIEELTLRIEAHKLGM